MEMKLGFASFVAPSCLDVRSTMEGSDAMYCSGVTVMVAMVW